VVEGPLIPSHWSPRPILVKNERMASILTREERWSAVVIILLTTAVILGVAIFLLVWQGGGDKAQGAAYALIGAAATHLLKDTHDLLRRIMHC
jgi:hypothetical protein